MKVEKLTSLEQIKAIRKDWEIFLSDASEHSFFMTWDWLVTWWEHFGKGRELFWIMLRDESGVILGAAPLYLREQKSASFFRYKELRFIGTGAMVAPEHLDLLALPDHKKAVTEKLAEYLIKEAACWDELCLTDVSNPYSLAGQLALHLNSIGLKIVSELQSPSAPYVPLPATWEDYFKSLKDNMRHNIKRRRRKAEKNLNSTFQVFEGNSEELAATFDSFKHLHGQRKKSQGIVDKFEIEAYKDFHHTLIHRIYEKKRLYLAFMMGEGKPIAGQYGFLYQGHLYGYQTGFDLSYSKFGAFQILSSYVIEDAISKGFTEFDLLRGEEPYKFDWTTHVRRKITSHIFSSNATAQRLYKLKEIRKRLVRKVKKYRKEGLQSALSDFKRILFRSEEFLFYKLPLNGKSYKQTKNGLELRTLKMGQDISVLSKSIPKFRGSSGIQKLESRFQKNHKCIVGLQQGRVVHMSWVNPNAWSMKDGADYDLPSHAAFLYDTFTHELCRGQGIGQLVAHYACNELENEGKKEVYTVIRNDNNSSIASLKAVGFERTSITAVRKKILAWQVSEKLPDLKGQCQS